MAAADSEGHQQPLKKKVKAETTTVEFAKSEPDKVLQELIATLKEEEAAWAKEKAAMQKTIDDLTANAK